jgi:hypothetical protein
MRYEINPETFEIKIYNDLEIPFCIQPHYPNGDTFDSVDEATAWAQLTIEAIVNPEAPNAPLGKGLEGTPKPTSEEIEEYLAKQPQAKKIVG